MIAVKHFSKSMIETAYNRRSWLYSKTISVVEEEYHRNAVKLASVQYGESVLEVAVGPGSTFLELAKKVGHETTIYGIDLSSAMLDISHKRLCDSGYKKFELRQADANNLPYGENKFDLIYNAYMLDIMSDHEIEQVLTEYIRVLKPGGRIVLLNMSKKAVEFSDIRELFYKFLPRFMTLYLLGGCRPIFAAPFVEKAGFINTQREFMHGHAPSEIVTAIKPYDEKQV